MVSAAWNSGSIRLDRSAQEAKSVASPTRPRRKRAGAPLGRIIGSIFSTDSSATVRPLRDVLRGAGTPADWRTLTFIPAGQLRVRWPSSIGDPFQSAKVVSTCPFITGSTVSVVVARSMMSPSCRPSGWMLPVSVPSSIAASRLVSRRSTVKVWPEASTSITLPSRRMCSLLMVTVSVAGCQFSEILPADSPSGFCTRSAISE